MSNSHSTGSGQPATGAAPGTERDSERSRGLLFIVSAPSGAGKTTLVERLVEQLPHLRMSRSYTSRAARAFNDRCRSSGTLRIWIIVGMC